MTMPGFVLGFIVSTIYGVAFHAWRGGNLARLVMYVFLGWVGFWLGQMLAVVTGIYFWQVGTVYYGMATIGSAATLGIGYWLSLSRQGAV